MIPLKFGTERANQKNFPPNADEWDLHQVFYVEKKAIDDHLCAEAVKNWHLFKDIDKALAPMKNLNNTIAGTYAQRGDIPARIYRDAVNRALEPEAPTKGEIRTMTILLVLSMVAESTVMLMQQALTRDFNWFIFVIAFMLGLGGFLQGHGVGHLLVMRWKKYTEREVKGDSPVIYWGLVAIGTLLILLIAWLRGSTAFDPAVMFRVFCITLLFGEAVSLFEALRTKYKKVRATLLAEMLQAQKWEASLSHQDILGRNGYLKTYMTKLAELSGVQINVLEAHMAKLTEQSDTQISVSDKPETVPTASDSLPRNVYPIGGDQR